MDVVSSQKTFFQKHFFLLKNMKNVKKLATTAAARVLNPKLRLDIQYNDTRHNGTELKCVMLNAKTLSITSFGLAALSITVISIKGFLQHST